MQSIMSLAADTADEGNIYSVSIWLVTKSNIFKSEGTDNCQQFNTCLNMHLVISPGDGTVELFLSFQAPKTIDHSSLCHPNKEIFLYSPSFSPS